MWSGTYTYNGDEFSVTFFLSSDGTFNKVSYKNGNLNSSSTGIYEVNGRKVTLHPEGEPGHTEYKYKGGVLVNSDHKFYKAG